MLRAIPADEIERSVGVDPWFAQNAVAFDRGNLLIGPHILQKTWDHLATETGVAFEELRSVDLPETEAEALQAEHQDRRRRARRPVGAAR